MNAKAMSKCEPISVIKHLPALLTFLSALTYPQAAAAQSPNFPVPPPSSITQIAPYPPMWPSTLERGPAEAEVNINVRVNTNPLNLLRPQTEPSITSNPAN